MILLTRANVYAPEPLGLQDILIEGRRIARIEPDLSRYAPLADAVYALGGATVVPGYIDAHVHITGGGGEQGPASRCPECPLTELTKNGITTVLGLLGTDGTSRSLENLLFKCQALREEGVSAYMLTGSYQYPSPVMTGSVMRDIALVEPVIGCKIALSDHRSSSITTEELIRLAADVRLGGMISGKAGVLTIHMGSGRARLSPVLEAARRTEIPISTFWPTHVRRTRELLADGLIFIDMGGTIDMTATDTPEQGVAAAVAELSARGVDLERITMSSDAFGSQPRFDGHGRCVGLSYVSPRVLHKELRAMVLDFSLPLEKALGLLTVNPARMMKLSGKKGEISVGADADLIVYSSDLQIDTVFAGGALAVSHGEAILKGRFER